MNIDVYDTKVPATTISPLALELLASPLPFDLPAVDKDLLILMAAYYGDIDRYVRLRRPEPLQDETDCCIRGIYHNTMFAIWWSKQQEQSSTASTIMFRIDQAISARMIMNNVLHRMQAPSNQHGDPYLIWYPSIAAHTTYRELFRLRPSMAPRILRACIAGGYAELFNDILFQTEPDDAVIADAKIAGEPFTSDVEQRMDELGGKVKPLEFYEQWKRQSTKELRIVSNALSSFTGRAISADSDGLYEGDECNAQGVEVLASVPEHWRKLPPESLLRLDYSQWP